MKTKLCPIKYMHDFPDYPCKVCYPEQTYSWFKTFLIAGLLVAGGFALLYTSAYLITLW